MTPLWLAATLCAQAAPATVTHSGRVLDASGAPVAGSHTVLVELLDPSDAVVHTETQTVAFHDGYYAVVVGAASPLDRSDFSAPLRVRLSVDGTPIGGAQPLSSAPYALAVDGLVRVSAAPTCDGTQSGALRWNGQALEACDGAAWRFIGGTPPCDDRAITKVSLKFSTGGSHPTTPVTLYLYSGTPSGTDLGGGGTLRATSTSVSGPSITVDAWTDFVFPTPHSVQNGPHYLVIQTNTGSNGSSYFTVRGDSAGADATADTWDLSGSWTTSTYQNPTGDAAFKIQSACGNIRDQFDPPTLTTLTCTVGDTWTSNCSKRSAISFDPSTW
jgi:hypothetical protein